MGEVASGKTGLIVKAAERKTKAQTSTSTISEILRIRMFTPCSP